MSGRISIMINSQKNDPSEEKGSYVHRTTEKFHTDSNLLARGISLPGGRSELKADGSGVGAKEDGVLISPSPGFVIKTKLSSNKSSKKIFINVCASNAIKEPHEKQSLDKDGKEIVGLNVSVAVGQLRDCLDKSGNESLAVDCIVHPKVIEDCHENKRQHKSYETFVCELLIQYVGSKYKDMGTIDKRYKLPNLSYHGYVDKRNGKCVEKLSESAECSKQWVKDAAQRPSITEISSSKLNTSSPQSMKTGAKKNKLSSKTCVKSSPLAINVFVIDSNGRRISLIEFISCIDSTLEQKASHSADVPKLDFRTLFAIRNESYPNPNLPLPCDLPEKIVLEDSTVFLPVNLFLKAKLPCESPSLIKFISSASMCTLSAPGLLSTHCTFPFPIDARTIRCEYETSSNNFSMKADLLLSSQSIEIEADVGSNPWTFNHAFRDHTSKEKMRDQNVVEVDKQQNKKEFESRDPWAHFGLNLGAQITAEEKKEPKFDSETYVCNAPIAEDRFHMKDVMSRFMLEKQEKERESRVRKFEEKNKKQGIGEEDCKDIKKLSPETEQKSCEFDTESDVASLDIERSHNVIMNAMRNDYVANVFSNKLWSSIFTDCEGT